jgi:DNA-binding NarL/FixJ family response regulator
MGHAAGCPRILIADDHDVVRAGLRAIIEAQLHWRVVAEADNGKEAVLQAIRTKPDIAIVDYALPVMNGVEVMREIRARLPETEVLAFTMHESDALVYQLLEAGARSFILKSEASRYLVAAIESLAAHRPYFVGRQSERLVEAFLKSRESPAVNVLSPRERTVVQLIAEGHGNKEIASILNLSIKTIETHRATAMRKLAVTSTAALVRYAVRNKLVEP